MFGLRANICYIQSIIKNFKHMKNQKTLLAVTAVMFALCTSLIVKIPTPSLQIFFGAIDLFIITLFAFISTEFKNYKA